VRLDGAGAAEQVASGHAGRSEPGGVTCERQRHGLHDVDLPRLAVGLEPFQNERFMKVWEGTSQNQWSNTPKSRAIPLSTGSCSGV
ncbi:MAG TPA: hypothetical protein VMT43_14045, partial [Acidimicrobiales bacterium]|nr:hypothetical protein [Acidimicrobiales bacterium]